VPRVGAADAAISSQRIDKWLWCARFFKSRALAAKACHDGRIRIAGQVLTKAHYALKVGDVLTFPLGPNIRVIRIVALAVRRGPPAEARALYEDLAPAGNALPTSAVAEIRRHADAGGNDHEEPRQAGAPDGKEEQ
jgi:ribosome-associated heat shock protein Hsp15